VEEGENHQVCRKGAFQYVVHDQCQSHIKVVESCFSLKIKDLMAGNPGAFYDAKYEIADRASTYSKKWNLARGEITSQFKARCVIFIPVLDRNLGGSKPSVPYTP
jgi:hypothetical protein